MEISDVIPTVWVVFVAKSVVETGDIVFILAVSELFSFGSFRRRYGVGDDAFGFRTDEDASGFTVGSIPERLGKDYGNRFYG